LLGHKDKYIKDCTGVHILENTYLPGGGGISAGVIWRKNMKRGREKGGKCKRNRKKGKKKGRKGKKKGRKGKEKEKMGN
jgi:hypothetical protein